MAKAPQAGAKKSSGKKTMTKSQFVAHLADKTQIKKKEVDTLLEEIVEVIKSQVGPKGPGKFVLPGLCRVTVTKKPAVKGGEKKINRLTGAEYITKDKPASVVVKLRPVKALKDAMNA